jgi:hypothetical protein
MARAGWPGRSASSTTKRVKPDPDHRGVLLAQPDQLRKEGVNQSIRIGRQPCSNMLTALGRQVAVLLEHRGQQIVLAAKIRVQRSLR